jgi:hypothetical protein
MPNITSEETLPLSPPSISWQWFQPYISCKWLKSAAFGARLFYRCSAAVTAWRRSCLSAPSQKLCISNSGLEFGSLLRMSCIFLSRRNISSCLLTIPAYAVVNVCLATCETWNSRGLIWWDICYNSQ